MKVASENSPQVAILMGSDSDWPVMQAAARIFDELGVPYEARVVSAHRTPDLLRAAIARASWTSRSPRPPAIWAPRPGRLPKGLRSGWVMLAPCASSSSSSPVGSM